jgi:Zn-dependent metalloprotease
MTRLARRPHACIVPPDLLHEIAKRSTDAAVRQSALDALAIDAALRQRRAVNAALAFAAPKPRAAGEAGSPQRYIYDQKNNASMTPGTLVRSEGQDPVADDTVDQAYDGFGATYKFYWEVLKRDSIDDKGMEINGMVHFDTRYNNAFWDGEGHMWFGDGDGTMFTEFTKSYDVIGHELTHGVTQYTANLAYSGQSGALNESISDVFGSLVKQYALNQTADEADWLIGADVVGPELSPALRSMKNPGQANKYDNQPADMGGFVKTTRDNGGVHTNSGIPNRAFYLAASAIGGYAWETAGRIWYAAMNDATLRPTAKFKNFAQATIRAATATAGEDGDATKAVTEAWHTVKVL